VVAADRRWCSSKRHLLGAEHHHVADRRASTDGPARSTPSAR
jgi:hypothetical protein